MTNDLHTQKVSSMKLTFLFPCLNEEETLGTCLDEIKNALASADFSWEIIVADNGSEDASCEIAEKHGVRIIHVSRRGYGEAIRHGIMAATGEYVVFADADGSYPLDKTIELVNAAENKNADMVIASRFKGKIEKNAMPFLHRYLGTPTLTLLINILFHAKLSDCNSGFRLVRKDAFVSWNTKSQGMEFASELLTKALKNKGVIVEVPGGLKCDIRTKVPHLKTWRDGMRHLLCILSEAPSFFEIMGIFMITIFSILQIASFFMGQTNVFGINIFGIHTQIMSLIGAAFGVQFYLLAAFIAAVSPDERISRFTRKIIQLAPDILFFILCLLCLILFIPVIIIIYTWIANHFSSLDFSSLLLLAAHVGLVIGFTGFGILELHIVKRHIAEP